MVVATVMGQMPALKRAFRLKASAPPEKDSRSFPSNSSAMRAAISMVNRYRDLPLMYISSLGSSPAFTSTGKVLLSFRPKETPLSAASLISRRNMGTASLYCRSSLKW